MFWTNNTEKKIGHVYIYNLAFSFFLIFALWLIHLVCILLNVIIPNIFLKRNNVPTNSYSHHMFISPYYANIHGRNQCWFTVYYNPYNVDKQIIITVNLLCKFSIWLHISTLTICLYFVLIKWYVNHINITFFMSFIPLVSPVLLCFL
jgi:hypothetical protein